VFWNSRSFTSTAKLLRQARTGGGVGSEGAGREEEESEGEKEGNGK
jgi:hypothetical protein